MRAALLIVTALYGLCAVWCSDGHSFVRGLRMATAAEPFGGQLADRSGRGPGAAGNRRAAMATAETGLATIDSSAAPVRLDGAASPFALHGFDSLLIPGATIAMVDLGSPKPGLPRHAQ